MNILVTAIGSMAAPFVIETLQNMGSCIVGIDIYPKRWVASAKEVDFFYQVPITSQSALYQNKIIELCHKHAINMIIPLTDVEIDHYDKYEKEFSCKGIIVAISNHRIIQLVRDKLRFYETFRNSKISVIPTYTKKDYIGTCNKFPCIAKKRNGRSSEGLRILDVRNEFDQFILKSKNYIFQPFIKGDVITIDILKSDDEKLIYIARKELIRTKNGAGTTVEIIEDKIFVSILEYFCNVIDFEGCINLEFIKTNTNYFLMDINPRFSAGIVFSNIAGYNFVENHVRRFLKEKVSKLENIKYGVIIARKYIEVIV
jgi:carbamoyl-phosphate synthase large subunit